MAASENQIIYEAIEFLLQQADLPNGFSRDGLIKELEGRRSAPCPLWADDFQRRYPRYSIERIKAGYQEACRELIEYFNQD